jgi:hypothetical protein
VIVGQKPFNVPDHGDEANEDDLHFDAPSSMLFFTDGAWKIRH